MAKQEYVQIDNVKNALEQVVQDDEMIQKVLDILNENTIDVDTAEKPEAAPDEQGEEEKEPRKKKQYAIVVYDPNNDVSKDLSGWVVQIPEDEDVAAILGNIKTAGYNFNATKKGRKYPVTGVGQILSDVPSKLFKPYGISVKTKEPVQVLVTDGVLPKK